MCQGLRCEPTLPDQTSVDLCGWSLGFLCLFFLVIMIAAYAKENETKRASSEDLMSRERLALRSKI